MRLCWLGFHSYNAPAVLESRSYDYNGWKLVTAQVCKACGKLKLNCTVKWG